MLPRHVLASVLALGLVSVPAAGQSLIGEARAVDGDSLAVSGIEVRLFGIDAPEGRQTCNRGGSEWPCGEAAAGKLRSLVEGKRVTCRGRGRDTYGRVVAVCEAGGLELNRAMVAQGWATAFRSYSQDYVADEVRAKASRIGIWDSTFMLPEDFRHSAAAEAAKPAPVQRFARPQGTVPAPMGRCAIKGNRSRRGDWIYHLPGMPYYEATRAEEIFCTEAEAQAAGYRRAIVR